MAGKSAILLCIVLGIVMDEKWTNRENMYFVHHFFVSFVKILRRKKKHEKS